MLKNAVITSGDVNVGDFIVEHWLPSLKANCVLSNTEIIVLDYGFSAEQRKRLDKEMVRRIECKRDGHVVCIRFRDMAHFFSKNRYNQVLSTDGGDIIFQSPIEELFSLYPKALRAVSEDFNVPFEKFFLQSYFAPKKEAEIRKTLRKKRMVNAGILVGPHALFLELCQVCNELMVDQSAFGPDQVAVNYWLYHKGFVDVGHAFNFVCTTCEQPFVIREGEFFFPGGRKIPIVHNAGGKALFRPIHRFGFGPGRNQLKTATYWGMRIVTRIVHRVLRSH